MQTLGSCLPLVSPLAVIATSNVFKDKSNDPTRSSALLRRDVALLPVAAILRTLKTETRASCPISGHQLDSLLNKIVSFFKVFLNLWGGLISAVAALIHMFILS